MKTTKLAAVAALMAGACLAGTASAQSTEVPATAPANTISATGDTQADATQNDAAQAQAATQGIPAIASDTATADGQAAIAIRAADLPNPPVTPGDISDRPYTVIAQITAGVRKATLFSKAASQDKIYRELWERAKKKGADAVIHASFGKSHVSALSWGQTNATGIAIKFDQPQTADGQPG